MKGVKASHNRVADALFDLDRRMVEIAEVTAVVIWLSVNDPLDEDDDDDVVDPDDGRLFERSLGAAAAAVWIGGTTSG